MIQHKFMPKSLYARFLWIIILPMLLVQFVSVYIFYERHWDSMSRNMANSLSGEIAYIINALHSMPQQQHKNFLAGINHSMNMKTISLPATGNPVGKQQNKYATFSQHLKEKLPLPINVHDSENKDWLIIDIQLKNSTLKIITSPKRITNPTTYIFILWMTGSALLLTLVAILFLKNQLRAIVRLTEAAENFDRGIEETSFRPGGATEIRRASIAFIEMRERIKQLITKRHEASLKLTTELKIDISALETTVKKLKISNDSKELKKQISALKKTLKSHQPETTKKG